MSTAPPEAFEREVAEATATTQQETPPFQPFTAFHEVVTKWHLAMYAANRARHQAELAYAGAVLKSMSDPALKEELKNKEARDAYADQMTADLFRIAADAQSDAAAYRALVDYFINPRRSQ